MADYRGYIREHSLVMARHLGCCLDPRWRVHHRNGVRTDNRLENLELFCSSSEHARITWAHGTGKYKYVKCLPEFIEMANPLGYVLAHRLFMAQVLGFCLDPRWEVHHIDGNKSNNSIENLMLFSTRSAHRVYDRKAIV